MRLTREQQEQLGRVIAVVLSHPDDPLTQWRVHSSTPPAETIIFHDDGSLALADGPRRRYRLIGDDVQVDDESDPHTHTRPRFAHRDGQSLFTP